jgi:hypothetical protein
VLKSCTDYTIGPLSYICDHVIAVVYPEWHKYLYSKL